MTIEPNHIYLSRPSTDLYIENNLLRLHKQEKTAHTINMPINVFFKSLGMNMREKAVGIILSGAGSDGMDGIRYIKEQNGIIIVQNNSAKYA